MITLQGAELAIPLETSWHPGGCPDQAGCWGLVEIIRCVCVWGGSLALGHFGQAHIPYQLWGSVSTSQVSSD